MLTIKSLGVPYPSGLNRSLVAITFASAFAVLAMDPLLWLVRSWSAPGYDSPGGLVFLLVICVFVWSLSSPLHVHHAQMNDKNPSRRCWPVALLGLSFLVRLASQVLAINVLGAFMLALDVLAFGWLLRLDQRLRAVSPTLLAALFCFALPLEPMLQRTLGFGLQQVSATFACGLLSLAQQNLVCEGIRITIDSVDVLVDLPCSGARLLILLLTAFFFLGCIRSLSLARAIQGLVLTLAIALVANTLRIALLALGMRYHLEIGIDVMQDPWHSGIGLAFAGLAIGALLLWLRRLPAVPVDCAHVFARPTVAPRQLPPAVTAVSATIALCMAFFVVSLRPSPIDVSLPLEQPRLPLSLNGFAQSPLPLSAQERDYFATFGGAAVRAGYGAHSLLLVQTTSPLRHLHAPDVCFSASGHDIRYVGAEFAAGPVAVYRSRSPDGEDLRVRVRFVSESGAMTHSISEVVWRWLKNPGQTWTMAQTVSPWAARAPEFHAAVRRSLNVRPNALALVTTEDNAYVTGSI